MAINLNRPLNIILEELDTRIAAKEQGTPPPALSALSLSSGVAQVGTAQLINIAGATSGSTITGTPPDGMTLNNGARTIAGTPTQAGTFTVVLTETLAGATGNPRQTTVTIMVAAAAATLGALTLSAPTVAENTAPNTVVSGFAGKTGGSTLSLTLDGGGRFALSGGNLVTGATGTNDEAATSHQVTVRETLPGATNSPRDTTLTVNVTNVFEAASLSALSLSSTTFTTGTPSSGSITGATTGSTIAATGLPSGLTIDGPARTWSWSGSGSAGTTSINLTETLADSANSPRGSTVAVTVATGEAPATLSFTPPSEPFYARTSKTGGAPNRGYAPVPVPLVSVSKATAIWARRRSPIDNSILQVPWRAAVSFSGTGPLVLLQFEANDKNSIVDLAALPAGVNPDSSTSWVLGSGTVDAGDAYDWAGQSLITDGFTSLHDPAGHSEPIHPAASVYAAEEYSTPTWGRPVQTPRPDGSSVRFNSAALARFTNIMIAHSGVACCVIGAPAGNTMVEASGPGGNLAFGRRTCIQKVGRVEGGVLFVGHSNASQGRRGQGYIQGAEQAFNLLSANSANGDDMDVVLLTIPENTTGWAHQADSQDIIRRAGYDYIFAKGKRRFRNAIFAHPLGMPKADGVHLNQAGNLMLGDALGKAFRDKVSTPNGVQNLPATVRPTNTTTTHKAPTFAGPAPFKATAFQDGRISFTDPEATGSNVRNTYPVGQTSLGVWVKFGNVAPGGWSGILKFLDIIGFRGDNGKFIVAGIENIDSMPVANQWYWLGIDYEATSYTEAKYRITAYLTPLGASTPVKIGERVDTASAYEMPNFGVLGASNQNGFDAPAGTMLSEYTVFSRPQKGVQPTKAIEGSETDVVRWMTLDGDTNWRFFTTLAA